MMTFKNLRYGLSSSVVLAASLFSVLSYAATDSIGLTVITTVEMGTCTATLVNDSDQDISVVDFGDWICPYISRHLLSLNPLLACCRRYSRGER